MEEYANKDENQSRTLDSYPKASRQASISDILQTYKNESSKSCSLKQKTVQREEMPNNTGLPDNLKLGIENLSGYSMDDIKVHYNSDKPAQLKALAYAQGTDIHIAPGQEQHLPHEAWHVVQQKQGRVQPTILMQGANINDNTYLEKEADSMGNNAIAFYRKPLNLINIINRNTSIIQRCGDEFESEEDSDFPGLGSVGSNPRTDKHISPRYLTSTSMTREECRLKAAEIHEEAKLDSRKTISCSSLKTSDGSFLPVMTSNAALPPRKARDAALARGIVPIRAQKGKTHAEAIAIAYTKKHAGKVTLEAESCDKPACLMCQELMKKNHPDVDLSGDTTGKYSKTYFTTALEEIPSMQSEIDTIHTVYGEDGNKI